MLSQPEFNDVHWTSLQPNGFYSSFLGPAIEFIKDYRETGKQGHLSIMIEANTPTALVDSRDVGAVGAALLAQEDTTPHNQARYVLNGPKDTTGEEIRILVEQHIGQPVEDVRYKDLSFIENMAANTSESKKVMLSIKKAIVTSWEGQAKAETTSKQILELCPPRRTVAEATNELVQE